jgi:RimJ/RimL family protein N-acetyltransferase
MIRVASPFPAYAIPRMWDWMKEFGVWRVNDDFGPTDRESFIEHWLTAEGVETWGVWRDEELGGIITVQQVNVHLATAHMLFKKSFFGMTTTIPATREVFAQVFARGVGRIESYVFEDNAAMVGLAKKLGAEKEGRLRERTIRKGRKIDLLILGLLAHDFYRRIEDERQCHPLPSEQRSAAHPPLPADSVIDPALPPAPAAASAS